MAVIRNLEQIRAIDAYNAATNRNLSMLGANGGEVVKKLPVFFRENGLLATLAFALEKDKRGEYNNRGYYDAFQAIVTHLKECKMIPAEIASPENLFAHLTGTTNGNGNIDLAIRLRVITAESLAYMDYLRRFVKEVPNA